MHEVEVTTINDKQYILEANWYSLTDGMLHFCDKQPNKLPRLIRSFNFSKVVSWRFIENENHSDT